MPTIIAEIGCNHKGQMDIAQQLIKIAAQFCNVDIVKFQKRTNTELLSHEQYSAPHPNAYHAYGDSYGAHREFLEFDPDQHKQLMAWCAQWGLQYSVSVWDLTAAQEMAALKPKMLKVPSATNLDTEMLCWLLENYAGEIHLSLGMTTQDEEERIVALFQKYRRAQDLVLYACTSGYPVPFADICLLEITRIRLKFGSLVKAVGFSGHHLGISADIAALTLGADYFERHFTLDRTWKGTDHAASLEPDGLRRLVRDLQKVNSALTYKSQEILEIEAVQRQKLKSKLNEA